jgi:ADP-heptose:LPS heptosyltransferase
VRKVLVVQLARFGDVIQSKRLLLSIAAEENTQAHLCVDASLARLASLVYPFAQIHAIPCHANAGVPPEAMLPRLQSDFSALAAAGFDRVYLLNASPLSYALARLFPPESLRGYVNIDGQPMRGSWARMASRLVRHRRTAPLNLVDLWAWHHPAPIAPERVNPIPKAAGGNRIGIVMAGRESRRSLPPPVLAPVAQAIFQARIGPTLVCIGSKAERPLVRQLVRHLPPQTEKRLEDRTGATELADLPELLQGLDLVISPDTGAMHLAAHLGVPVLAFFLSSAWCFETGPYGPGHKIIQAATPCAPCLESEPCGKNLACLEGFKSDHLLAHLGGKFSPQWPAQLMGCVTKTDPLGVVCSVVDGEDPRATERLAMRNALKEYLGLPHGPVPESAASKLYEDADWMLPGL